MRKLIFKLRNSEIKNHEQKCLKMQLMWKNKDSAKKIHVWDPIGW